LKKYLDIFDFIHYQFCTAIPNWYFINQSCKNIFNIFDYILYQLCKTVTNWYF